jgi:ABC-type glycerol-3-phosphate transport system substrate-binding protein
MKKFLALFLVLALALSMMTACGKGNDSGNGDSNDTANGKGYTKPEGEPNKYGWIVPKETIKFSYYDSADPADQKEEDERIQIMHDFYLNEFNVDITRILYNQDGTERLNLMLAGGNYPEMIVGMTDVMAEQFIHQGRALQLDDLLENYGQNIISGMGGYLNLLRNDKGELYKLSDSWGNTTDNRGRDFSVRYDLLQKSGLKVYDSFESFHNVVKTLVEQNPTNSSGEKTYGFTAFTNKGEEFYQAPLGYLGFLGTSTGYYKVDADDKITHWVDTEEGLEVAQYINRFWREGLIDPDFQTKDYDSSVAFMSNERVVANIGTWWHSYVGGHGVWSATEEDWDMNKRFINVTFEETDVTPALIGNNYIRSNRVILTDKCKNPEEIMTFLNWETTQWGQAFTAMGVPDGENKLWTVKDDGTIVVGDYYFYTPTTTDFNKDIAEEKNANWAYHIMAPAYMALDREPNEHYAPPIEQINLWDFIPDEKTLDMDRVAPDFAFDLDVVARYTKPYVYDATLWTVNFAPEDAETTILQDIKDNIASEWIKVITADSPEACEKNFNAMKEKLHSLGLDTLVEAQQKAYNENKEKFEGNFQ